MLRNWKDIPAVLPTAGVYEENRPWHYPFELDETIYSIIIGLLMWAAVVYGCLHLIDSWVRWLSIPAGLVLGYKTFKIYLKGA